MGEAIGIRLDEEFLKAVDDIGREESTDRSTIIRKLLNLGFSDFMKQRAKEKYIQDKVTLSQAARIANITIWEMQKYLVETGYKSEYSIKDLEEDMAILDR